ncbi:Uncharacterised protein [Vibrio cholerae]|nr:Uncharacterised protein [Vibrio cholerae]
MTNQIFCWRSCTEMTFTHHITHTATNTQLRQDLVSNIEVRFFADHARLAAKVRGCKLSTQIRFHTVVSTKSKTQCHLFV